MGIVISFFDSIEDLSRHMDQQLAETRKVLLSHSKKVDEARKKFDEAGMGREDKKKWEGQGGTKQTEVSGFKVLVNPTANYELNLLDEAIRSAQQKIEALERVTKQLLPSLKNGRIAAIFDDGIPTAFMHYLEK